MSDKRARAPAGGCEVDGVEYEGGQYLPEDSPYERGPVPERPEAKARREAYEARQEVLKAQAARDREVSQHVGTVGARVRDLAVTVRVGVVLSVGFYGPRYLTVAEDAAGNVITYKGATTLGVTGDRLTLSATIAEHYVYKDVKQTRITRPKVLAETRNPDSGVAVSSSFSSPWST